MAQVPYSPNQSVESRATPIGPIRVDTPAAAFGAELGRALGQAGSITEHASDEIFGRAMAMQKLENEAIARENQANYLEKQGKMHAEFGALQGSAAGPAALADYIQKSKDLRSSMRDGITSPDAQRMFDNDTMHDLGRNIFSAAGHSAGQMKTYALATNKAVQDNIANNALQNPNDELQFKASLEQTRASAQSQAISGGAAPGDPIVQSSVDAAVSKLVRSRIEGAARTNPAQAQAWLKQYTDDGSLRGQDIGRVTAVVQSQAAQHGPKAIADGIADGTSLAMGQGILTVDQARAGIKAAEGGNYGAQGPVVAKGQYAGQRALGAYQVMPGNLPKWLAEAGMKPMTSQQFLADSEAQDRLFDFKFGQLMKKYGSGNAAANVWFTGQPNPPANVGDGYHKAPEYLANFNAGIAGGSSLEQKVKVARSEATRQFGTEPGMEGIEDLSAARVITVHRQEEAIARDNAQASRNVLNQALVDAKGQGPISVDDLRKDPQVAKALDALPPKDQLRFMHQVEKEQRNDNEPSPKRDDNFKRIVSMSHFDPDGFKALDPYHEDLTADQRKAVVADQVKIMRSALSDTADVKGAVARLGPMMSANGVDAKDKEDYQLFTGALANTIRDFKAANARPPNPEDIDKMGQRLLTERVTAKGYIWNTRERPYQMKPPEEIAKTIRNMLGADATDEQVNSEYVRRVYQSITRSQEKPRGRS